MVALLRFVEPDSAAAMAIAMGNLFVFIGFALKKLDPDELGA